MSPNPIIRRDELLTELAELAADYQRMVEDNRAFIDQYRCAPARVFKPATQSPSDFQAGDLVL